MSQNVLNNDKQKQEKVKCPIFGLYVGKSGEF